MPLVAHAFVPVRFGFSIRVAMSNARFGSTKPTEKCRAVELYYGGWLHQLVRRSIMLSTLSPIVNDLKGESPIVDAATPLDCALHQSPNLLPPFPPCAHALSLQRSMLCRSRANGEMA